MVNSAEFGKRLDKIMKEHDLTASAFADRTDVGRSSISHILSGRNKPSLEFVMKIVQEFEDVELYWLLNGKGTFPITTSGASHPTPKTTPHSFKKVPSEKPENRSPNVSDEFTPSKSIENSTYVPQDGKKPIERIVIFYTDGTFKNFTP